MVQICALASGSNGNCYYIGNSNEAVIVDCGISNKLFKNRLAKVGLQIDKIKAVFISHEHIDHVKGMRVITSKNNIEAYISKNTFNRIKLDYRSAKAHFFTPGDTVNVGQFKIHTFNKQHDAVDPVSFRVEVDGVSIAVLTDLGEACDEVKKHLAYCDAAFLETNYENDILFAGPYPFFLKNRVSSVKGHLSNDQAIALIKDTNNVKLKTLILSHISAENNSEEVLKNRFKAFETTHLIEVASRLKPSKLIKVQ